MLCTVFNNSICCHELILKKNIVFGKKQKIKQLIYEPVSFCFSNLLSLNSQLSCLACFITHTPSCFVPYCDWPLSRDRRVTYNGRLTGV